jgi:cell wall-associated NlpC family hydrolase
MLDKRLHAFRDNLADARLEGLVKAEQFVDGIARRVVSPVADIRREPNLTAPIESQALYGESFLVFEDRAGFCWAQLQTDKYVGYIESHNLTPNLETPNYKVAVPRTFTYSDSDLKMPIVQSLSLGSQLSVIDENETRGTHYLKLSTGDYIIAHHAKPIDTHENDPVSIALSLLHTPYLWGGRSAFGIDCSGLVQLCYATCGYTLPRDSDMLSQNAGVVLQKNEPLKRSDLVFWKGHVALMESTDTIIHASGHSMAVVVEFYEQALNRIEPIYGLPTVFRRVKDL